MLRLRLVLLVTIVVIVQAGVFPAMRFFGVVPDLGLMVALAVAIRMGPAAGAGVGFCTGLGVDLFVQTPLGLTALCYTLVAYAAGSLYSGLMHRPRFAAPWVGFFGGLASGLLFVGLGIIFGVDTLRDWQVLGVVLRVAVYDAILAVPAFFLVDRLLGDVQVPEALRW
jgi:rod shape-determining protein MreD